jgi:hypothetical protein
VNQPASAWHKGSADDPRSPCGIPDSPLPADRSVIYEKAILSSAQPVTAHSRLATFGMTIGAIGAGEQIADPITQDYVMTLQRPFATAERGWASWLLSSDIVS